jgi:hypothetical protein
VLIKKIALFFVIDTALEATEKTRTSRKVFNDNQVHVICQGKK